MSYLYLFYYYTLCLIDIYFFFWNTNFSTLEHTWSPINEPQRDISRTMIEKDIHEIAEKFISIQLQDLKKMYFLNISFICFVQTYFKQYFYNILTIVNTIKKYLSFAFHTQFLQNNLYPMNHDSRWYCLSTNDASIFHTL